MERLTGINYAMAMEFAKASTALYLKKREAMQNYDNDTVENGMLLANWNGAAEVFGKMFGFDEFERESALAVVCEEYLGL